MTEADLHRRLRAEFPDANVVQSWGETGYFFNPGLIRPRGTYVCTVKNKDGENDRASGLDRDGVFRLNIGLPKDEFLKHFDALPARPPKGEAVTGPWKFTSLSELQPHPVYAWMGWVSILNPLGDQWVWLAPMVQSAIAKARQTFEHR